MKKRIKKIAIIFFMLCFTFLSMPVISVHDTAVASEVEARTDILEWRYKVIGDHLYKRLFNRSTGRWETDWILVQ